MMLSSSTSRMLLLNNTSRTKTAITCILRKSSSSSRGSARGGRSTSKPTKQQKSQQQQQQQQQPEAEADKFDPQNMAFEMISGHDTRKRVAGTESIQKLTTQQQLQNYATAAFLLSFVGGVWWYSMHAVGQSATTTDPNAKGGGSSSDGMDELLREAQDARRRMEQKSDAEREVSELLEYESAIDEEEEKDRERVLNIAVAAPAEIAEEEEKKSLEARGVVRADEGGRPLWKKVVFFWRRE